MEDIMGGPTVKLISYTQPVDDIAQQGITNALELVAFCARVSNPSNQYNSETAEKLVVYLAKHKHWSPLEMVDATLEIMTTRDITHQIIRHRSFSFQEFSQRYADPTQELDFDIRETRMQDTANRQNSIDLDLTDADNRELNNMWVEKQQDMIRLAKQTYTWAVTNGIAKEQARAILPEGLTVSRLYMAGTLRSWIHYVQLRSENGTQKEHIDIAKACAKVIAEVFPLAKEL